MINLRPIHTGVESQAESATKRIPALHIPVKSVRFRPYNSIALPTKGALIAIPTNITAAVIPMRGVGKCLSSKIADVTGMITTQHNPRVNTDTITVFSGEKLIFMSKAFEPSVQRSGSPLSVSG